MHRKVVLIMSISLGVYLNAQQSTNYRDFSELRNASDVYGNNFDTGSARYMGMAGAMGAIGGEASAASINPAAIGVNIISEFSGTLSIDSNKNKSTLAGKSVELKDNKTNLSYVGGVISIPINSRSNWRFVNVGVNYLNRTLNNEVLSPANNQISGIVDWTDSNGNLIHDQLLYDGHRYERFGQQSKMGISVGGNYDNRFYIGAGLNFHSANFDQYDYYKGTYASDGLSEIYDKQFSPYSEIGNGFSASVGIIGKVSDEFRLGAALETPTWWTVDRSYTQYTPVSNADPSLSSVDTYNEQRNFRSPMKATVSAAYVANKNFAIDVDYSIGFMKPEFTTKSSLNNDLNNYLDKHSKGQSELRVGAEYRLEALRLRAGYAFATNPFGAETLQAFANDGSVGNATYNNLYVGKRNTLGAGIGYDFRSFFIDAAYQNSTYDYDNAFAAGDYATYDNNYNGTIVTNEAPIVSSVKNTQSKFLLTVGFRF